MIYGTKLVYDEAMKHMSKLDPVNFEEYINNEMVRKMFEGARKDLIPCIEDIEPNYELNHVRSKELELEILTREQGELIRVIAHNMTFGDFNKEKGEMAIRRIFSMKPTSDLCEIKIREMWESDDER